MEEIPLPTDTPLFDLRVTLDGQEYLLTFDWSERAGRWYMSIQDLSGVYLARGIKLISNWPLLRQRSNPALPPGNLFVYDPLEGDAPGFTDLGRTVILAYTSVPQAA